MNSLLAAAREAPRKPTKNVGGPIYEAKVEDLAELLNAWGRGEVSMAQVAKALAPKTNKRPLGPPLITEAAQRLLGSGFSFFRK